MSTPAAEETQPKVSSATSNISSSTTNKFEGRKRYNIRPPCTTGDFGRPSNSIYKDARRVFRFIEDQRHLVAHELYEDVKKRIEEKEREKKKEEEAQKQNPKPKEKKRHIRLPGLHHHHHDHSSSRSVHNKDEIIKAKKLFQSMKAEIETLEGRVRLFKRAKTAFDGVGDGWIFSQTFLGISTFYRREKDGSLSIRVEGEITGLPLFEQVVVLREGDLNYKWAPFVTSSQTICELDKLDAVGWFQLGLPMFGIARDACFRAIGCDSMLEDGCIVLVGQGVNDLLDIHPEPDDTFLTNDPVLKTLDIPPVPTRLGSGRMTIRTFDGLIYVTSPTSAATKIITNINPNMSFIPQALIDFLMKKVTGILLYKMQHTAKKAIKDPVNNAHARRMREEADFYQRWLLPKCEACCEVNGWEMPPVAAFNLTPEQLAQAQALDEKEKNPKTFKKSQSAFENTANGHGNNIDIPNDYDNNMAPNDSFRSSMSEPVWIGENYEPTDGRQHTQSLGNGGRNGAFDATMDSISEISDLSSTTWSVWKHNPIVSYLREVEQKTMQRKAKIEEESRLKTDTLLTPKSFEGHQLKRLEELKKAKERARMNNKYLVSPVGSVCSTASLQLTSGQQVLTDFSGTATTSGSVLGMSTASTASLASVGGSRDLALVPVDPNRSFRLFTITGLTILLFTMLHFNSSMKTFKLLYDVDYDDSMTTTKYWFTIFLKNIGTLLYIMACGGVHFSLCDILLIFAFHSYELGLKSGEQIKGYYSSRVRQYVAIFSGFLVSVSVGKAVIAAALCFFAWSVKALFSWSEQTVTNIQSHVFDESGTFILISSNSTPFVTWGKDIILSVRNDTLVPSAPMVEESIHSTLEYIEIIYTWLVTNVIYSNFTAKTSAFLFQLMFSITLTCIKSFNELWTALIRLFGGNDDFMTHVQASWRYDAFMTCRYLLSHTAIFLLALVFLCKTFLSNNSSNKHEQIPKAYFGNSDYSITGNNSSVGSVGSRRGTATASSGSYAASVKEETHDDEFIMRNRKNQTNIQSRASRISKESNNSEEKPINQRRIFAQRKSRLRRSRTSMGDSDSPSASAGEDLKAGKKNRFRRRTLST